MFKLCRNSISIGNFEIRFYGMLIALGVLLAIALAEIREKRLGLKKDTTLNLAILCVPVAIVCARIYYVIFEWDMYKDNLLSVFNLRQGGLAIYGGVIGGFLAGMLYSKIAKVKLTSLMDLAAPSVALGQAIGRWGNYLNEEAYGIVISNSRFQFFPACIKISSDGLWHAATFFYESIWCFGIVVFILILERKRFFRKSGDMFLWYIFLYALERCAVEGLRLDSLYIMSIRVSQALSLALMIAVSVIFLVRLKSVFGWLSVLLSLAVFALILFGVIDVFSVTAFILYAATLIATLVSYTRQPHTA